MQLRSLRIHGFKSFAQATEFFFDAPLVAIVGPNGSGKSNVVEAIRFALGEQSMKSLRGGSGTDLIFKGSSLIRPSQRASVSLVFDNHNRVFTITSTDAAKIEIDFDEVVITREVYGDGQNRYLINSHEVRLKDIIELIASVNIGVSGHHIISQGEADRLLNAHPRERRHMLEDALGLKIYHYRIKESQRKLDKTRELLKESYALRREIAPHLTFLHKQVEKIHQASHLRQDLFGRYCSYLRTLEEYLQYDHKQLLEQHQLCNTRLIEIRHTKQEHEVRRDTGRVSPRMQAYQELETRLAHLRSEKEDLARKAGRLEGVLETLRTQHNRLEEARQASQQALKETESASPREEGSVALGVLQDFFDQCDAELNQMGLLTDISELSIRIQKLSTLLRSFLEKQKERTLKKQVSKQPTPTDPSGASLDQMLREIAELDAQYQELTAALASSHTQEEALLVQLQNLQQELAQERAVAQENERQWYVLDSQERELQGELTSVNTRLEAHEGALRSLQEEIDEAVVLLGEEIWNYKTTQPYAVFTPDPAVFDRNALTSKLEDERRHIERLKIKIEDIGGGSGNDVIREYEETLERDRFLEREIRDLETTLESLQNLMADITSNLRTEFVSGVEKINTSFLTFFQSMFGGGDARIELVRIENRRRKNTAQVSEEDPEMLEASESDEEDENGEEGIAITVQLPRKRVQDLTMLSGGERSLTSIALLFALSQVNPPPFLVLDETDAALDEANSKRYGDMIEELSRISQLIVVTHNRETMSRAGILYGVTLGTDGSSQLLSVKFDEAVQYAK